MSGARVAREWCAGGESVESQWRESGESVEGWEGRGGIGKIVEACRFVQKVESQKLFKKT